MPVRSPGETKRRTKLLGSFLLLCAMVSCSSPDEIETVDGGTTPPFVESGDLTEIHEQGTLRVLLPMLDPQTLPRNGHPLDFERELVREYAESNGLTPYWVYVKSRAELIPSLLEGRGDLIAANLTATTGRREQVSFTVPIDFVREQIVARAGDELITQPADLVGRRVAVRRSSSFWPTVEALTREYPGIRLVEVPENIDTDELIHRVGTRQLDVTVADSNWLQSVLAYRDDVRAACDLTGDRPIAWAVRPESQMLLRSLNHFLTQEQLTRRNVDIHVGDLASIKDRKVLRVLTRNSAATYFLWRGELMGFEYELARKFAQQHGMRMEIVIPPRHEDILTWLAEGRGDLVAAAITPSEARQRLGVAFSRPYNHVSQVVVSRSSDEGLDEPIDLTGRTLFVRRSSAYWDELERLRGSGVEFAIQAAPEELDTEELIALVADGQYDLTVADSHILDIELTWRTDVDAAFPLGDPVPLSWAVRRDNPELKDAIDSFIKKEYRGLFYNVIYKKYFADPRKIRRHVEYRLDRNGELSPYDAIVKRHATEHGFDWRLIVAQMFQESEFDPKAKSFAGAVGLLQVLPRTARQMGLTRLDDPAVNIEAGVKYLAWLRDRYSNDLAVRDRMWFVLAAYNAGHGHVVDARRLARQQGLDPNKWFDNVERAMLLLSRKEFARQARYGYCRGSEPVKYVREIRSRYEAYLDALDQPLTAGGGSAGR